MGIREDQKEKRKNEILMTALKLFVRKGYAATKISDIAEQAGMSTGLMFHYFTSKENLYEELIKLGIKGPMSVMAITHEQPITFFEESVKGIFHFVKENPAMADMFVLMSQASYNEAAPAGVKKLLEGMDIYTPTAAIIEEGQRNKSIREGNSKALAIAFWCAVQGIVEQLAARPELPFPDSNWVVDMIRRR